MDIYKTKAEIINLMYIGMCRYRVHVRILLAEFTAPCSGLHGCTRCTSSPTCSMWWCADDGLAPQIGYGPLHVQSWTRVSVLENAWMSPFFVIFLNCPYTLCHLFWQHYLCLYSLCCESARTNA